MRAFVQLREVVETNKKLGRRFAHIERILAAHDARLGEHSRLIEEGFEAIRELMEPPEFPHKRIGF
ncbi:hypothetical protein EPO15_12785 [bacterium]|nr:MAG: hypothetical protein EPO15_12785 [bacterium]